MEKRQGDLLDFHYDILKEILIRAARSSDGAKTFANAISVCKAFRQFIDDGDVLRAVAFDDLIISDRWKFFQLRRGLICRCAQAGQEQAKFLLGKIILKSNSFMLIGERRAKNKASSSVQAQKDSLTEAITLGSSFMENFSGEETRPNFIGRHFDFVKIFLSRARLTDFEEMQRHLMLYMTYYTLHKRRVTQHLGTSIAQIIDLLKMVCSLEEELEPPTVKNFNETRDVNWKFLKELEGKEGSRCRIELGAEEREEIRNGHLLTSSTTSLVEKLDKLHKHLTALNAIMQGIGKASRSYGKTGAEVARVVSLSLLAVKAIVDRVEELRTEASLFQALRTDLISKLHDFVSRSTEGV